MKRNYLAESSVGFQYGGTPLEAITGLLNRHKLDYKGMSFTITVYDTTDVPLGARTFTELTSNRKVWTKDNERGFLVQIMSLLDEETADYMFDGHYHAEHIIMDKDYFERVQKKLNG